MMHRPTIERCIAAVRDERVNGLAGDGIYEIAIDNCIRALEALPSSSYPEGMVLVPVEPTPIMNGAGDAAVSRAEIERCLKHDLALPVAAIYKAMLAASPATKVPNGGEQKD